MAESTALAATTAPAITDAELVQRARRAWRIALISFLVPVSIATHWPRLGFGGGGVIDKFVHFLAFGTLAWLWMNARPFGRAALGFAFAAAWVYIDERTQALEILGRTFSLYDMIAGWLGIAMAGALYALHRFAAPPASVARADGELVHALAYADGFAWRRAALVTLAVIAVVGTGMVLYDRAMDGAVYFGTFVYAIGYSGFVGVAVAAAGVELYGAALFARRAGHPARIVRRSQFPARHLLAVIAVALALLVGYELFVRILFPKGMPEDLQVDREGFLVLRRGFLFATLLVSLAVGRFVATRLVARANPDGAGRR